MSHPTTKTVFLHIGAGKTGTTAIQNCLSSNSELLRKNGTLFPMDPYFLEGPEFVLKHRAPLSCGNGVQLFYYVAGYREFDSSVLFDELGKILSRPYKTFIFSCEMLQYGESSRFSAIGHFLAERNIELKIVYCVRDSAAHAFSSWRQLVVYEGETLGWPKFLSKYISDRGLNPFEHTLRSLSQVIHRENIIVLNYSSLGQDFTRRFFKLFGDDYAKYQPATIDNASEDDLTIDSMLQFNRLIAPLINENERKRIAYRFYKTLVSRGQSTTSYNKSKVLLSKREYHALKAALQPRLDFINHNFLRDEPIVVARSEQVGGNGRPSHSRRAARLAKKTAVSLAGELPSLAFVRHLPITLTERFVSLIRGRQVRAREARSR